MNQEPQPTSIRLDKRQQRLVIHWSDGMQSAYPSPFLRANCPSAGERVAREDPNPLVVLRRIPSSEIVDVRLVGHYAINFTWADGHNVGIYTWEYLRELANDPAVEKILPA